MMPFFGSSNSCAASPARPGGPKLLRDPKRQIDNVRKHVQESISLNFDDVLEVQSGSSASSNKGAPDELKSHIQSVHLGEVAIERDYYIEDIIEVGAANRTGNKGVDPAADISVDPALFLPPGVGDAGLRQTQTPANQRREADAKAEELGAKLSEFVSVNEEMAGRLREADAKAEQLEAANEEMAGRVREAEELKRQLAVDSEDLYMRERELEAGQAQLDDVLERFETREVIAELRVECNKVLHAQSEDAHGFTARPMSVSRSVIPGGPPGHGWARRHVGRHVESSSSLGALRRAAEPPLGAGAPIENSPHEETDLDEPTEHPVSEPESNFDSNSDSESDCAFPLEL